MSSWWVNPADGTLRQAAASPGPGWAGPFATKSAAIPAILKGFYHSVNNQLIPGVSTNPGSTGFLANLTSRAFWIRFAEGTVGGLLLVLGVNGIIHAATGVDVAGKAVKAAAVGAVL